MADTLHIRIKKQYAADLMEDLIKVDAVESADEEFIDLTAAQKAVLNKELEITKNDPAYLLKWEEIKHRYKRP